MLSILALTLRNLLLVSVLKAGLSYGQQCANHPAFDGVFVEGPVTMGNDPLDPFDAPKIWTYNETAVEDWSHDAVSADGSMGLAFTYSRGTVGPAIAAQRVFVSVAWPNGTRYMEFAFTEQSDIETCPDKITARFYNTTSAVEWKSEYTTDFKHSVTTINSPTIKGTIKINALAPPLYPNGLQYPNIKGNPLFAPMLWWEESVPAGTVETNLAINGTPFIFSGVGGRERNWNSLAWSAVCEQWDMVRGVVGPYRFIGWKNKSKIEGSQFSLVLLKGRQVIFRTQNLEPDGYETYGSIARTNNSSVRLASPSDAAVQLPESRFSGYVVDMVSPKTQQHWRFSVDFTNSVYWFPASETARIGGFTGNVTGGEIDKYHYSGLSSGNAQELVLDG